MKQDIIYVSPSSEMQLIYINNTKSSWIKIIKLTPQQALSIPEFEELWYMRPDEKHLIRIAGKLITCPRYTKSYLKGYNFSGLENKADMNMPESIEKLLTFARQFNPDLNQSLVNWYDIGGSIGKHSDDVRQLKPHSDIFSFSFGPAIRTFILEPKNKEINSTYHIRVEDNTMIIMGGHCQMTHFHSVPKVKDNTDRRINVTFRCFL